MIFVFKATGDAPCSLLTDSQLCSPKSYWGQAQLPQLTAIADAFFI